MHYVIQPSTINDADVDVPGDKSISHRAIMLGSIAEGQTDVSGFLPGDDCLATIEAFRSMGVAIEQPQATELVIHGVGLRGLTAPAADIDLGNSGTAMRLLAGVLAGQNFTATLTGDESLASRPMQRIITPLSRMGANIESADAKPPLTIRGNAELHGIDYRLPMASAQVKSAILLAGLYARGQTTVSEPATTRDHTERMLRAMGADLEVTDKQISLRGRQTLRGCAIRVPSDLSSAAFLILAALLSRHSELLLRNVGVNPTRTGVIDILQAMGARIAFENSRVFGREPVADIRVRPSSMQGIVVDPALVSLAIDEFPVLFVAAAAASGKTVFSGLAELRVKESDRISAMADGLRALGIEIEETADGAVVNGGQFAAGEVQSFGDHRVAMALAVAATIAAGPVTVHDVAAVETSFPGFDRCLRSIGVDMDCHGTVAG
jgi:3-phosphoshikimate 1-carboxyvinyltransferase